MFIKKGLQHSSFLVKFEQFSRTPILKKISGGCFYLLKLLIPSSEILLSFTLASSLSRKQTFLLVFPKRGLLVAGSAKYIDLHCKSIVWFLYDEEYWLLWLNCGSDSHLWCKLERMNKFFTWKSELFLTLLKLLLSIIYWIFLLVKVFSTSFMLFSASSTIIKNFVFVPNEYRL